MKSFIQSNIETGLEFHTRNAKELQNILRFELRALREQDPELKGEPIPLDSKKVVNIYKDALIEILNEYNEKGSDIKWFLSAKNKSDVIDRIQRVASWAFQAGLLVQQGTNYPVIKELIDRPKKSGKKGGERPKKNPVIIQAILELLKNKPDTDYLALLDEMEEKASHGWEVLGYDIIFEDEEFVFFPIDGSNAKKLRSLKVSSLRRYYDYIKKEYL
jgi:hypothetical protein